MDEADDKGRHGEGKLPPEHPEQDKADSSPALYGAYGVPWRCNRHPWQIDDKKLLPVPVAADRLALRSGASIHAAISWIRDNCRQWKLRCFERKGSDAHERVYSQLHWRNDEQIDCLLLMPEEVDAAAS